MRRKIKQFWTQINPLNSTLIPHPLPYIFFKDLRIYIYMYSGGKLNRNTEVIPLKLLTNGDKSNEKDEEKKN